MPVRIVVQAFNEQFPPDRNVWPQHPSMHRLYVPRPDGSVCYCGECLDMSSFAEVVEYAIETALFAQSMRAPYYIAFLDAHPSNKDMGLIIDQWRASFNDKPTPSSEPCQPTTPSEELRAPAPPTEVAPAVASTGAKPVRVYLMSAMCTFKADEVITNEKEMEMMCAFAKQLPRGINPWLSKPRLHMLYTPCPAETESGSRSCTTAKSYADVVNDAISFGARSCPKSAPYGIVFINTDLDNAATRLTVLDWRASFDDKYIPASEEESRSSASPMVVAAPTPSTEVDAPTVVPTEATPLVVDPNNKRVRVYVYDAMCEFGPDEVILNEDLMKQAFAKQRAGRPTFYSYPSSHCIVVAGEMRGAKFIDECRGATSNAEVVNRAITLAVETCPARAPYSIAFIQEPDREVREKILADWRASFDDKYIPQPKPCNCSTSTTPVVQDPIAQWREAARAGELADEEMAKRYRLALAEKVNDPAYFIKAPPSWCVDEEDHSVFLAHVKRLRKLNANVLMSGHPARFAALESIGIHFGPVEEHNVFDLYSMCDSCTTGASKVTRRILLPWVSDEQKKE